jgi:hypothetical protein
MWLGVPSDILGILFRLCIARLPLWLVRAVHKRDSFSVTRVHWPVSTLL